jgi:hypothetical protein
MYHIIYKRPIESKVAKIPKAIQSFTSLCLKYLFAIALMTSFQEFARKNAVKKTTVSKTLSINKGVSKVEDIFKIKIFFKSRE